MSVLAGEHKRKLLDEAQALLGYHRKAAIRALGVPAAVRVPWIITGRPTAYEPGRLLPWLRYRSGRRRTTPAGGGYGHAAGMDSGL